MATFKWLDEYALSSLQLWPGEGHQKILYEHHGQGKRDPFTSDGEYSEKFESIYNSRYEFFDDVSEGVDLSGGALRRFNKRAEGDEKTLLDEDPTSLSPIAGHAKRAISTAMPANGHPGRV